MIPLFDILLSNTPQKAYKIKITNRKSFGILHIEA
jgi:hypothetical protein